jgi:hypothetical protein
VAAPRVFGPSLSNVYALSEGTSLPSETSNEDSGLRVLVQRLSTAASQPTQIIDAGPDRSMRITGRFQFLGLRRMGV